MKNKINIEITQDGWTTDILFNGKKYRERHERIPTGSKCVEGDFESEEELPDDIIGPRRRATEATVSRAASASTRAASARWTTTVAPTASACGACGINNNR